MAEALTYIRLSTKPFIWFPQKSAIFVGLYRGVEQWKLVGLITRRSLVQIQPPLPIFVLDGALRLAPFFVPASWKKAVSGKRDRSF